MNNWLYENKEYTKLEDFDSTAFGFIYYIENKETGKFYIGKKQLLSVNMKKLGKKEMADLPIQRGRKVTKKQVIKESNWKDYFGSNKQLLEDIKKLGEDKFERKILYICKSKKQLTYFEAHYQMQYEVLTSDSYNDSIFGKFFRQDFL